MGSTAPKGVKLYKIKFPKKTEEIGFFYNEVVWNLLEDAGPKGLSITELRELTGFSESYVTKLLGQLLKMRRLKRTAIINESGLPRYNYLIRRRWLNVK